MHHKSDNHQKIDTYIKKMLAKSFKLTKFNHKISFFFLFLGHFLTEFHLYHKVGQNPSKSSNPILKSIFLVLNLFCTNFLFLHTDKTKVKSFKFIKSNLKIIFSVFMILSIFWTIFFYFLKSQPFNEWIANIHLIVT